MPQDYFESNIYHNGKVISCVKGSYLSYVSFDNEVFYDYKTTKA